MSGAFVHPTAEAAPTSSIGAGTKVWHQAQVMDGVSIGQNCTISKGVYVGVGCRLGSLVKVGNHASLFNATVEDQAFIAPGAMLLEDPSPRSTLPNGERRGPGDFRSLPTRIRQGASVGAGAIVLPGVEVGEWAMVGAGSVVNKDVGRQNLVVGNPARLVGFVCLCGLRLDDHLDCSCGLAFEETNGTISPRAASPVR